MPDQSPANHSDLQSINLALRGDIENYVLRIKEEQSRLLGAIGGLSLGFLIIDTKNNILIKNLALDSILGLEDHAQVLLLGDMSGIEEILMKSGFDLRSAYQRTISEHVTTEFKDVTLGGKFLHIYIAPIISPIDGTTINGASVIVEDTTEAKLFEQGRDEFFSIASHELRTPLTAIRGNASMLIEYYGDKMLDQDMREMIDDMLISSERLIRIVNDFLDVSRLEQRRMQFNLEQCDVNKIIREAMGELRDLATKQSLTIEFAEAPALPAILADTFRVKQVLTNLVGNAIHYTDAGGINITAEVVGKMVKIKVRDSGVGISLQDSSLLFRKFQQVGDNILARKVMSTGLGLYISKLMVESMGGVIALEESVPGKGSTFSFTLPVFKEPDITLV